MRDIIRLPKEEYSMNEDMMKKLDEQIKWSKIIAGIMGGILLVVCISAIIIIPPAVKTLNDAKAVMISANETLESANNALDDVDMMAKSIIDTSDSLKEFITENGEAMTGAVQSIEDIDFEGLNKAIQDLQDAVGPFAKTMRMFK